MFIPYKSVKSIASWDAKEIKGKQSRGDNPLLISTWRMQARERIHPSHKAKYDSLLEMELNKQESLP